MSPYGTDKTGFLGNQIKRGCSPLFFFMSGYIASASFSAQLQIQLLKDLKHRDIVTRLLPGISRM